jgi:hypothetical protein
MSRRQVWSAALEGEPKPAQLIKARGSAALALVTGRDGAAF